MSNEKSVRQVLVDARAILASAWNEGQLYDPFTKCYCALGAIGKASGLDEKVLESEKGDAAYDRINPEAVAALADVIKDEDDQDYPNEDVVYEYNDMNGKEKTLEAFDAAIAKLPE